MNSGLVPDWLRWRSTTSPDSLAIKAGQVEWSYAELHERVSALSSVLRSRGVGKGDRVAFLMSPSGHYIAAVHAVARVGAIAVPLNHRQSSPELREQLRDCSPKLVVHDEVFSPEGDLGGSRANRWATASELVAGPGRGTPVAGEGLDVAAPHAIVYTSGSSGAPKGVELSLSNLMWNALSVGFRVGASSADRWLLCMPLFHVGGYTIIFRSVLYGSAIVIHPRFDARRVSLSLDNDGVTLVSLVPTMLTALLEARGGKPLDSRVRLIFVGGGQPSASLVAAIRERRLPVLLTYGMTETCSQVAVSNAWSSSAGPAYLPLLPNEVAVTKPGRRGGLEFARPGEAGEVAVRGGAVFRGYWRKPSLTRARFMGRWFLTGDMGVLQFGAGGGRATGAVAILGRKEETIVSGGEKVFPAEVEAALREHPAVKDAVVVGVEDAKWGQRVVAVVEAKPGSGAQPSGSELSSFLRERVGRYKIPKQYHFWATLPRTPTGKPKRGEVRLLIERGEDKA